MLNPLRELPIRAGMVVNFISIRLVRTFSLRCLFYYFSKLKNSFVTLFFAFMLTATDQLRTRAMGANYPHLAPFAPCGQQKPHRASSINKSRS